MYPNDQTVTASTLTAQRVVPLLQAVNRLEELVPSLVMRLDVITVHAPSQDKAAPPSNTVTSRLHSLGDTLQYLLDNIEL